MGLPVGDIDRAEAAKIVSPDGFAKYILGHDTWSIPRKILRSVLDNEKTAVKACHASSKTFTAAEAVLWWIATDPNAVAITTAPTWTQVERVIWGEIKSALGTSKLKFPAPGTTEIRLGPNNYAMGLSTNQGVRFQGLPRRRLLIVIDEAPGVMQEIWAAIEGIRAGGFVRVLALGNPVIAGGPFYDAFGDDAKSWTRFTISAFDTPNLAGVYLRYVDPRTGREILHGNPNGRDLLKLSKEQLADNPRWYLTTKKWVLEKFYEWGPGHPEWDSRVLGDFPAQSPDSLFSLTWVEQAVLREFEVPETVSLAAGVDVAGPGEDETVVYVRHGPNVIHYAASNQPDTRGFVLNALKPYKDRLELINVDSVGIGWGMYQHLRDEFDARVRPVNVGEAPNDSEKIGGLSQIGCKCYDRSET